MTPRFSPGLLAAQLEVSAKLIRRYGDDAVRLARDWHSPMRSNGDGRSSKGDHSDPTPAAVFDQSGEWRYLDTLNADAATIDLHLCNLVALVCELGRAAETRTLPPERKPGVGAGQCACCGEWVTGGANDRLRSGFCDACRKAWERAGRPDRATFKRLQRVEQVGDDGDAA